MIKELLKEEQPIVFHALDSACKEDRISSAYLFSGPYGTPKYEAAILLAQSILCEKGNGLACETCNTCRRVKEGTYTDMIVLDGSQETISKTMIDELQEKFSKTALEENGQKVYIIRNAENATVAAQNSMLKFLEEPGSGITAILTTDNMNKMLPTIISRCTQLPFLPSTPDVYYKNVLSCGVKEEDAYFMSHIVKDLKDLPTMYNAKEEHPTTVFEHAISMLKQFLNVDGLREEEFSVDWEVNWSSKAKDAASAKKENLLLLNAFFELVMLYCRDAIEEKKVGVKWYQEALEKSDKNTCILYLGIALQGKDACNKYNDLNLVFYQFLYRVGGIQ